MKLHHTAMMLALLAAAPAGADVIATIQNDAGGLIELTDDNCPAGVGQFVMASAKGAGTIETGCWYPISGMLIINWHSGDTRRYPMGIATFTPYAIEKYGDKDKQQEPSAGGMSL